MTCTAFCMYPLIVGHEIYVECWDLCPLHHENVYLYLSFVVPLHLSVHD